MSKRTQPSIQVQVRVPKSLIEAIDAARRKEIDLPSRAEIMRRCVQREISRGDQQAA